MDFDTKASNIIFIIIQMKIFFQQIFFNTLTQLIWMKNLSKCALGNDMSQTFQL
jgi:hypothetical protein